MSMTTFSKVLAVTAAALSLAFLGFAFTVLMGGPNWQAKARELSDYTFQRSDGDPPTWSVTRGASGETVHTGATSLAEAVVRARQDLQRRQRQRIRELDEQIAARETRLEQERKLIAANREALDRRAEQLLAELEALEAQIDQVASQALARSGEAQELQADVRRRREEVFRLRNLVEGLEADRYRIEQQAEKLHDLMIRLKGTVQRLQRRKRQLEEQLGQVSTG